MIYDWRGPHYLARNLGRVRIHDAATGEEIQAVFLIDTDTHELRRFLIDDSGNPFKEPDPDFPPLMRLAQVKEIRRVVITPLDGADVPLLVGG